MDEMHERIKQAAIHVIRESQQAREQQRKMRELHRFTEACSHPYRMCAYAQELKYKRETEEQIKDITPKLKEFEAFTCDFLSEAISKHFAAIINARKSDPGNIPIASKEEVDALLTLWHIATDDPKMFGLATYEDYVDWCHGERELDLPDEKQEDPSFQNNL